MRNDLTPLKVLHVIPSISPLRGGPSKAVIDMVRALRETNVDAEIVTTNDHGNESLDVPLTTLTDYQGVPVRFFKRFAPPLNAIREFTYSFGFQRWLKKHIRDYDVVHIHAIFSFCSSYAMLQARKQNVPYIIRPIGQLEKWSLTQSTQRKELYLALLEKDNLNEANAIHFTAESEKNQALERFPNLAAQVIPLGIELPKLIPNANLEMRKHWSLRDKPTILFLSRLHPKKGIEKLLRSLFQLETIDFEMIIAGEGEPEYINQLNLLAQQLGIIEKCHFVGFVSGQQKDLLLQGCQLFALTSHSENFGIAVLEAMASGTAVLVSDEVALAQQVREQQLGFVSSLDNNEITQTLRQALTDLDRLNKKGEESRYFVEKNYQWPFIASELKSLYQQIITQEA